MLDPRLASIASEALEADSVCPQEGRRGRVEVAVRVIPDDKPACDGLHLEEFVIRDDTLGDLDPPEPAQESHSAEKLTDVV